MAEVKPLYIDSSGFPTELRGTSDSITLVGLTMNGLIDMGGNLISDLAVPTLSDHAASKGYVDAQLGETGRVENAYVVSDATVTAGDPVFFTAANKVASADADKTVGTGRQVFGVARVGAAVAGSAEIVSNGPCAGVLSGATPGDDYFLADGGGVTTTKPTGANDVMLVGYALNTSDLFVTLQYLGRGI